MAFVTFGVVLFIVTGFAVILAISYIGHRTYKNISDEFEDEERRNEDVRINNKP